MHQLTWTFSVSKKSASVKYNTMARVKLRLFRVYIESLHKSRRKGNPNEITDYFVCTANTLAGMSCISCHHAPARTIWKNTRLIMALNHKLVIVLTKAAPALFIKWSGEYFLK